MATLSTLAAYDDLLRYQAVLTDGTAEYEFHKFAQFQEECRLQWATAIDDVKRLQRELDNSCKTIGDLETKLFHARRLLEAETKARRHAEGERETVEKRMVAVRDLLLNERDIKEETRNKFAFLNSFPKKRKSHHDHLGNDINSTGSFLSDLSLTQSEDDFLDVRPSKAPWKKHRPSIPKDNSSVYVGKKARLSTGGDGDRRSVNRSHRVIEIGPNDKIVARTKVSMPQDDGPIEAESIIEAVPQKMEVEEPMARPKEFKTPRK
jgi:Rac GTPase-activating protein 1